MSRRLLMLLATGPALLMAPSTPAALVSGLPVAPPRPTAQQSLEAEIQADYVVANQDGWSPIEPGAARAVTGAPGVKATSSVASEQAKAFGSVIGVNGIDP